MTSLQGNIYLDRLEHNMEKIRAKLNGRARVMGVIKCNAYGHGAVECAKVLTKNGMNRFAVSHLQEALSLRRAGLEYPVLVLSETEPAGFADAVAKGITLAVSHRAGAVLLNQIAERQGKTARIHVNVDTGMGRFGSETDEVLPLFDRLASMEHLRVEGIFTHLSATFNDDPDSNQYTRDQINRFAHVLDGLKQRGKLPPIVHAASSTGFLGFEHLVTGGYYTHVRTGTLLFGYEERSGSTPPLGVLPVAEICARILTIKNLPAERFVSYDRTFSTRKSSRMAVLDVGYANGLHRDLGNRGVVVIHGQKASVRGKLTLGHTMVDVTKIPRARAGDKAVLAGPLVPALETSRRLERGLWEVLLPMLNNSRLHYIYEESDAKYRFLCKKDFI